MKYRGDGKRGVVRKAPVTAAMTVGERNGVFLDAWVFLYGTAGWRRALKRQTSRIPLNRIDSAVLAAATRRRSDGKGDFIDLMDERNCV